MFKDVFILLVLFLLVLQFGSKDTHFYADNMLLLRFSAISAAKLLCWYAVFLRNGIIKPRNSNMRRVVKGNNISFYGVS